MAKKIIVLLGLFLFLGSYAFCQTAGFDEFALRACLSDCYNTFSPVKNTSQFYDCLYRCKKEFEDRNERIWKVPG